MERIFAFAVPKRARVYGRQPPSHRLSRGQTTNESFYVEGKITSIINTTWGNLYIEDEDGNSLFIYGLYDTTGTNRFDAMQNPPAVGDTVCLYGPLMRYYSASTGEEKIEMTSARLISVS